MNRLRWDRIFFTVTVLLGALTIFLVARSQPRKVPVDIRLPGACECILERTASLTHPRPDGDAQSFATLLTTADRLQTRLPPGHYRLEFRTPAQTEPFTVPVLVREDEPPIAWDLSIAAPAGFSPVPPGPFIRGPGGPIGRTERLFFASRTEVTRAEYAEFLRSPGLSERPFTKWCSQAERIAHPGGCRGHAVPAALELAANPDRAEWPVGGVSWYDASAYAAWATETKGEGRFVFRLPSADEWEKMARGTDGRRYPWGNDFRHEFFRDDQNPSPSPVTARPERRSPYGLYATESNVAEWTRDAADPAAIRRIVMGRSFNSYADSVRLDALVGDAASQRSPEVGFRLVAEPR